MLKHLNTEAVMPSRVVVIGSQGFVGSHITKRLNQENIKGHGNNENKQNNENKGIESKNIEDKGMEKSIEVVGISKNQVNLLNEHASENLIQYLKPNDVVIIVSAIAPCKTIANLMDNLKMVQAVCAALEKCIPSQVVYISSDAVYADNEALVNEASPASPASLHGMMHSARELMLKVALPKIPLAILRPSLLYGAEDPHNGYGPNRFRRLVMEGKDISFFGRGEEKRDHIFIEDVAEIVSLVIQHRSEGILNIATGNSLSFRETAEMTRDALISIKNNSSSPIQILTTPRQNPITHRHFDIGACYKAFPKFHYTSFKEGLNKVLNALLSSERVDMSNTVLNSSKMSNSHKMSLSNLEKA